MSYNYTYDYEAMTRVTEKAIALQIALTRGRHDEATQLLRDSGVDCKALMERTNMLGQTLLHEAVADGELDTVLALVDGSGLIDVLAGGKTPAYLAATTEGRLEILKFLASKGADLNFRDPETKYSLLMAAIWADRSEQALFLIEQGVDFSEDVRSLRGWATIDFAATGKDASILFRLVEEGALASRGESVLALAVRHHSPAMVAACLAHPEYRRPLFEDGWENLLKLCVFGDMRERLMTARVEMGVAGALIEGQGPCDAAPRMRAAGGLSL